MEKYCDTNPIVILKMIDRLKWKHGEFILEPSAGTGAIIKEILNRYEAPDRILSEFIHFCELDAKRASQATVHTGATFKDFDFLCYSLQNQYSKIIAVPPFNADEWLDHTMKMYEHLKPEGHMVVLLPDKALENNSFRRWAQERKAKMEYIIECACNYTCQTFILEIKK